MMCAEPVTRREDQTVRPCPLCSGEGTDESYPFGTRWKGKLFRNLRCGRCGSSYLNPTPTEAELAELYDRAAYHDGNYPLEAEDTQTSAIQALIVHLPEGGRLLDFGCGNGHFLKLAGSMGFRCEGVEVDSKTCQLAESNSGWRVMTLTEFLGRTDLRYDVIHLGDVLEHLHNPAAMMHLLQSRLAPSGRFFVEGPLEDNFSLVNFVSRSFGRLVRALGRDYGWYLPLHLFRANADAQRRFFTNGLGYRVLAWQQGDDGWPYWDRGDSLFRARSTGHALKMAIALTSRLVTRTALLTGLNAGNRFATVVAPPVDAHGHD